MKDTVPSGSQGIPPSLFLFRQVEDSNWCIMVNPQIEIKAINNKCVEVCAEQYCFFCSLGVNAGKKVTSLFRQSSFIYDFTFKCTVYTKKRPIVKNVQFLKI
jgi:hypothetical protein